MHVLLRGNPNSKYNDGLQIPNIMMVCKFQI